MLFILVYDTYFFLYKFFEAGPHSAWSATPPWFKVIAYVSVVAVWPIFATSAMQVFQHVEHIKDNESEKNVLRHDRAVQVIVLPLVYATMCLSCLTFCYDFMVSDTNAAVNGFLPLAVIKAETCLWIADLYEAWALYQFGVLTLELLGDVFEKKAMDFEKGTTESRHEARALKRAHPSLFQLAFLGIATFVLVSLLDVAVALFYIVLGSNMPNFVAAFNSAQSAFDLSGFLASCTAIYSVYVVEHEFHDQLEEFCPFMKFLTVKILVSFAYGQQYFFEALQAIYSFFPAIQPAIDHVPVLGSLVKFNNAEFYAFYSALLIIECFFIALMHVWAWHHDEEWYEDEDFKKAKVITYGSLQQAQPAIKTAGY
jgi:hypothetical protein